MTRLFKVHTTASRESGLARLYILAADYGEAERLAKARIPSRATVWNIKELTPLLGVSE